MWYYMIKGVEMTIESTDVWTEPSPNRQVCFDGAFIDGVENRKVPYDRYKIVLNCNCIIKTNSNDVAVGNKHHAIVFYRGNKVVRLVVACQETNILKAVDQALNQILPDDRENLRALLNKKNVKSDIVNLNQQPIFNESNGRLETDICSCDRDSLLSMMIQGSYTESETGIGDYECNDYDYNENVKILFELDTGEEFFNIKHKGAFLNKTKTQVIAIQKDGIVHVEKFLTDGLQI